MAAIAVAVLAADGSGAEWSTKGSIGLTIAFLVVVAGVVIAATVAFVRRRRWRREVERLGGEPVPTRIGPASASPRSAPHDRDVSSRPPDQAEPDVAPVKWWTRAGWSIDRLFADREPSKGSSIAPRRPDGTRTKIFWFNGNGKGR